MTSGDVTVTVVRPTAGQKHRVVLFIIINAELFSALL